MKKKVGSDFGDVDQESLSIQFLMVLQNFVFAKKRRPVPPAFEGFRLKEQKLCSKKVVTPIKTELIVILDQNLQNLTQLFFSWTNLEILNFSNTFES